MAHPGHELRIHGWLEQHSPDAYVLTDGSGRSGVDRLGFSRRTLTKVHSQLIRSNDVWTDSFAYEVLLDNNVDAVIQRISRITDHLQHANIQLVVCDAIEGFNPVHDLCAVMAVMACRLIQQHRGSVVPVLSFPLEAHPQSMLTADSVTHSLNSAEWQRKLAAIEENSALQHEVERSFKLHGRDAFQVEVLSPFDLDAKLHALSLKKPFYEIHGEKRVATGAYSTVLRFQQHFRPLVTGIQQWIATQ